MARSIQQKQEIDSSLKSARKKQLHMLPQPPQMPGYEFACYYNPASSLGGDFYDFVKAPGGKLGIVIGDVTGHGIDAAIVMGMAKKTINIFGQTSESPFEVFETSNASLYSDLDDMTFISAWYGVLAPETMVLDYVRAGHNPMIHFTPHLEQKINYLKPKGLVLGMQKNEVFSSVLESATMTLTPGDVLINYTDGIVEAKSKAGEEYGENRLSALVLMNAGRSMQEMVDQIAEDFENFIAGTEQEDDVTLVAFRVLEG